AVEGEIAVRQLGAEGQVVRVECARVDASWQQCRWTVPATAPVAAITGSCGFTGEAETIVQDAVEPEGLAGQVAVELALVVEGADQTERPGVFFLQRKAQIAV